MKEDITKNLIQKSTINTSEDFTEKLLLKIEAEKANVPLSDYQLIQMFRYAVLGIIGVGTVLFSLMHLDLLPEFTVLNFQLKINKTPLLIITTLLLLMGANHILKLHRLVNYQNKSYFIFPHVVLEHCDDGSKIRFELL